MKKLLFIAPLLLLAAATIAQEAVPKPPAPPRHFYKLTYLLKEFDDAKVINKRDFLLTVSTGERYSSRLRAGSRLPIRDNEGKINYMDVGVNLDTRLEDVPEGLALEVNAEISSVGTEATASGSAPIVRQVRTNALALVPVNKPIILFTIDDPSSRHRFELEVTAVPQK